MKQFRWYFAVGDLITALHTICQQMLHSSHTNPSFESKDQSKQNQWFNDDSDEICLIDWKSPSISKWKINIQSYIGRNISLYFQHGLRWSWMCVESFMWNTADVWEAWVSFNCGANSDNFQLSKIEGATVRGKWAENLRWCSSNRSKSSGSQLPSSLSQMWIFAH